MLIAVNFHYIREKSNYPFSAIHGLSAAQFKNQIERLGKEGVFVSQNDICRFLADETELPERSILVTFDDGLREQYEVAYPILQELGVPAVFYVNPLNIQEGKISNVHQVHLLRSFVSTADMLAGLGKLDLPLQLRDEEQKLAIAHYNYDSDEDAVLKYILNFKMDFHTKDAVVNRLFEETFTAEEAKGFHESFYMTEEMLRVLGQDGCLGSHTYSHQPLGLLSPEELDSEFAKSQAFFESRGLVMPRTVSYPYGSRASCAQPVLDTARKFNFEFGFTMERAGNSHIRENALNLARFDCNDVIGGKSNLFEVGRMFDQIPTATWEFSGCNT